MIITLCLAILLLALMAIGKINNQADWGHWATNILDGLIRVYCRRFHRLRSGHIEIPEGQKLLLAPNHISGIDPFILITSLGKPVRFMVAKEEYEKPLLNWMFRAAGCIPVDRGGRVERAFRSALRAIEAGELVAIFPQGGIHHQDSPREKIKSGIIKLSQLTQCGILPIRINGIGAPGTIGRSVITRSHIRLDVHPVISPKQAQQPYFREAMAGWLLGRKEKI